MKKTKAGTAGGAAAGVLRGRKGRFLILNGLLTAFFSLVMLFGESFSAYNNWEYVLAYPIFSTLSFFCYWGFFFFISWHLARPFLEPAPGRARPENRVFERKGDAVPRRVFFLFWGFLLLCWLPYLIGFFPGIANTDVPDQLAQSFNMKNGTYEWIDQPLSEEVLINGHHPVFNTWIQGLFLRIGIALGSQNVGVFLHALWIALFTTGVFAWSLYDMRRQSVPLRWCAALALIFGLIPCFPLYGINLVKNSTYSAWLYLWLILLIRLAREGVAALRNRRFLFLFSLCMLMQMLNVKHGIHVVVLTVLFLLFVYRSGWKRLLAATAVPVFLVAVVLEGMIMPALRISPGSDREFYGFMYQQTARYVRDYPQDVTPEEREAIDGVLEYDRLAALYNPITSDYIKFEAYRPEQTKEDRAAYFKAWLSQFRKHPGVYLEATINGCFGFFYPMQAEWYDYLDFSSAIELWGDGFFQIYHPPALEPLRKTLTRVESDAKVLPIVEFLFRHGTYVWVVLWCACVLIAGKRYRALGALIPLLCTILVCVISPYNSNTRYLLPVIYGAGLCVLLVKAEMEGGDKPKAELENAGGAETEKAGSSLV